MQCRIDLLIFGFGYRHDVGARLIAALFTIFDHLDRARNLVDIARYAHHINDTVFLFADVFGKIRPAHVRHDRQFHVGFILTHDLAQVFFVAELIFPEFIDVEQCLGRFVTHFHIIDARGDVHFIQGLCERIRKLKIIAQPAVAQGRIQHLDVGTER